MLLNPLHKTFGKLPHTRQNVCLLLAKGLQCLADAHGRVSIQGIQYLQGKFSGIPA
jgi:hypothetical protein